MRYSFSTARGPAFKALEALNVSLVETLEKHPGDTLATRGERYHQALRDHEAALREALEAANKAEGRTAYADGIEARLNEATKGSN